MRKTLAIFLTALTLLVLKADCQAPKTTHGQASQKPAAPISDAPKQKDSPSLQPKPEEHIQADVRIVNPQTRDRYDKASFWINATLAVVGIVGIVAAFLTLRTVKRQADTFVSKERARITVDIRPFNPNPPLPFVYDQSPMPPAKFDNRNIILDISNSGETSAFIRVALCKACIKPIGWDARDEIINSRVGLPKVMPPHTDPFRHTARIEAGQVLRDQLDELGKDVAKAIEDGSQGIYVIGQIEFGDVFDNHWIVKFCRKWGAWRFGGQWQGTDLWNDFPDGKSAMNAEFSVQRPSQFRRIFRKSRGKDAHEPVVIEVK